MNSGYFSFMFIVVIIIINFQIQKNSNINLTSLSNIMALLGITQEGPNGSTLSYEYTPGFDKSDIYTSTLPTGAALLFKTTVPVLSFLHKVIVRRLTLARNPCLLSTARQRGVTGMCGVCQVKR